MINIIVKNAQTNMISLKDNANSKIAMIGSMINVLPVKKDLLLKTVFVNNQLQLHVLDIKLLHDSIVIFLKLFLKIFIL